MGDTLVGKAVALQLEGPGFKPLWVQCADPQAGPRIPREIFLWFFFALTLSPLLGIPENAGVM